MTNSLRYPHPALRPTFNLLLVCSILAVGDRVAGDDWPMFGHDSFRSNHTAEQIPLDQLRLCWTYQSTQPPQPAWAGPAKWDAYSFVRGLRSMRQYDPVFHTSIVGDRVLFASSVDDSVHCVDAKSGDEIWCFTTDAPVRVAPTLRDGKAYFGSDDGHAYCVRATDGGLVWKFQAVDAPRRIIHNGRFISQWPIRTGVLVGDGTAYFGASMLPWERSYLCAVDVETGKPEGEGRFVRELKGELTLEGPMLASAGQIVVPQGRIPPLLFNRTDGQPRGMLEGGGGCFVLITQDDQILHGPGNKTGWITQSNMQSRAKIASFAGANAMVVAEDTAYLLTDRNLRAVQRSNGKRLWQIDTSHPYALIKAGRTLVVGGFDEVAAFDSASGELTWTLPVHGRAFGLAYANGRLLVSTDEGAIHCFSLDGKSIDAVVAKRIESGEASDAPPAVSRIRRVQPNRDKSLVGRWVFQSSEIESKPGATTKNLAGAKVKDQTGRLAGTIVGESQITRLGEVEALALDGATDSVMLTGKLDEARLPRNRLTAEAWVRIDRPEPYGGIIGVIQDNGDHERGWLLGYRESKFCIAVKSEDGTGRLTYLTADNDFELSRWHHLVGTYDGREMKLFVDGKLAAKSDSQKGAVHYPDEAFVEIGAYHDKDEYFRLKGLVHEVNLYSRALTEPQIRKRYRAKQDKFGQAVQLQVAPHLYFDSPSTAVIRWQTDRPSPTYLDIRLNEDSKAYEDPAPKRDHEIRVDVPRRNQMYHYRIGAMVDGARQTSGDFECDTFFNYNVADIPGESAPYPLAESNNKVEEIARHILASTKVNQGICLVLGCTDGRLAYELARQSKFRVVAVDTDQERVDSIRERLRQAQCYGSRVAIHHVDSFSKLPLVGEFANLVVSERLLTEGKVPGSSAEVLRILRPSGGTAFFGQPAGATPIVSDKNIEAWLADTTFEKVDTENNEHGNWTTAVRGAMPGAGEWSHQYGTADNTAFGGETLQGMSKTKDLKVQWIGRPGPRAQPDRSGRKPSPLSVNGRLFVQGLHRLIGVDSFNGTILWSHEIPSLERFNIPRDCSNWCADDNYVFVAVDGKCWQLDAQTGEVIRQRDVIGGTDPKVEYQWGYVGRVADKIIATSVRDGSSFTEYWGDENAGWYDARSGPVTFKVCSDNLFATYRDSDDVLWKYEEGVIVNPTITARDDRLYFVECRNPQVMTTATRRIGMDELWQDQYMVALDINTGHKIWEQPIDTVDGTVVIFMACNGESIVVVTSADKKFHVYAFDPMDGSLRWTSVGEWDGGKGDHGKAMSRPAIVGSEVYVRPWVFDLATGKKLDLQIQGGKCGTYAATTNGLLFRSSNVTFWDRSDGSSSSWGRLRPGCWLSTIPAGGMVLSPEAGGGCSCGSWLETSVGFKPAAE